MNTGTGDTELALSERDEIEMLLPWYQMGTLEPDDHERVARYLDANPDMRAQLNIIEDERANTVRVNEAIGAPRVTLNPDALAAASPSTGWSLKGLMEGLGGLFMPGASAGAMRLVAAGLMAVVIGQAVTIGWLTTRGGDAPGYDLASGGAGVAAPGFYALARIDGNATFATIAEQFRELGVTVTDGPNSAGFLTLRIGPADMSEADASALMARLRSEATVIQVLLPRRSGAASGQDGQ